MHLMSVIEKTMCREIFDGNFIIYIAVIHKKKFFYRLYFVIYIFISVSIRFYIKKIKTFLMNNCNKISIGKCANFANDYGCKIWISFEGMITS